MTLEQQFEWAPHQMDSIETRIARLEAIEAPFDYEKVRQYATLLRSFLAQAEMYVEQHGLAKQHPLFDLTLGQDIALPDSVDDRLQAFFSRRQGYSTAIKKICLWFLREALLPEHSGESHYEPLIQLLENGGDFYEHHGDFCIRDAASLRFAR